MTRDERNKCRATLRELCDKVEADKSIDYAKEEDMLSNFKEMAQFTGTTKYQAWLIYFGKHMTSIINSIRRSPEFPQVESEPIKGRIVDAIVYLQILDCLMEEDLASKPKIGRPPGKKKFLSAEEAAKQPTGNLIPKQDPYIEKHGPFKPAAENGDEDRERSPEEKDADRKEVAAFANL